MNRSISSAAAAARVRSTMTIWAEDVADGDRAVWDPTDTGAPIAPATRHRARTRARRVIGVAAAMAISRDDRSAGLATAGEGETPSAAVDDGAQPSQSSPTSPPTAPPTSGSGTLPDVPVGTYARDSDGAVVALRWYPAEALAWPARPGSEDLQVGPYPANYWEEPDQEASSLTLFFADGVLYLDGDELGMRDDLVAFAQSLTRVPGTTEFEITPPHGYSVG